MSSKKTSWWPVVFLLGVLLVDSACSSSANPTSPSTTATSAAQAPVAVVGAANVTVSVNPNPVPFSGKPITDIAGCARRNNTWYYEQVIEESRGVAVTFHTQVDAFDGFVVNNLTGLTIAVPARGKVTQNPRWCSATAERHTAQTTFTGTDANGNTVMVQTPMINLMKP